MNIVQAGGMLGIVATATTVISFVAVPPAAAQPWDPCIVTPPLAECTDASTPTQKPKLKTAQVGDSCSDTTQLAESPDGVPLRCTATEKGDAVWTAYPDGAPDDSAPELQPTPVVVARAR